MTRLGVIGLTLGLLGCLGRSRGSVPVPAAQVVAPQGPHDEYRTVTVGDQPVLCAFRVGVDSTWIVWPPMAHPARAACVMAYQAWRASRR